MITAIPSTKVAPQRGDRMRDAAQLVLQPSTSRIWVAPSSEGKSSGSGCEPDAHLQGVLQEAAAVSECLLHLCGGCRRAAGSLPGPALRGVPVSGRGTTNLDGVPGRFGGVLTAGWGGPPERRRGHLLHLPPRILLEPVLPAALRPAVTHARSATRFVRNVMFPVALRGGPAAARGRASSVPDPGQVPQHDPRIVGGCLEPVIAVLGGDRMHGDDQGRLARSAGGQPPAAVPARRAMLPGSGD